MTNNKPVIIIAVALVIVAIIIAVSISNLRDDLAGYNKAANTHTCYECGLTATKEYKGRWYCSSHYTLKLIDAYEDGLSKLG